MSTHQLDNTVVGDDPLDHDQLFDRVEFNFSGSDIQPTRRQFVQVLGAGILIAVATPSLADAQNPNRGGRRGGFGGGGRTTVAARLHIAKDGAITLLAGKVECGQGARAELTQAVAEELRVPAQRITTELADTLLVPNDGVTAGSGTTPRTITAVRQAAAFSRGLLVDLACKAWNVKPADVDVRDGKVVHAASKREESYGDLASTAEAAKAFEQMAPGDVTVTPVKEWKVLGTFVTRPNRHDIVTGAHAYPSDIIRKGMLHGKILRPASYGAKLMGVDLAAAKAIAGVKVVEDGSFIGVAAPTTFQANLDLFAISATAKWQTTQQPSSTELYDYLKQHVRGGIPKNPFAGDVAKGAKSLQQEYHVAYVQHAPMEPRSAVAEWDGGKLTVWTGSQNPFGVRGELARAFNIPETDVRVRLYPDWSALRFRRQALGRGGGRGGARLAKRPASRFRSAGRARRSLAWAYFRPAGVIVAEASLDADGKITSWHFVNVNSGGSAIETPYRIAQARALTVNSEPPLRHAAPTAALWLQRRMCSPVNALWTSWQRSPAATRSNSAWPTSKTRASAPVLEQKPPSGAGLAREHARRGVRQRSKRSSSTAASMSVAKRPALPLARRGEGRR